ncbi:hypothetical protein Q6A91_03155 [Aliarcobacter skirrowii]|uniref:hypothetical protein n=1 Tax=Aliarcobacter skirrowii TaxID=28200 RepID=UPI0029B63AFB|nr:hypothetical protein [Aliarcobacter skirrowii]MDX4065011.1 hypothetical protein [Aliarcobacter skirrowii]
MKPKITNEQILKEIERQREKLKLEVAEIGKKREILWKEQIKLEETISRYEKVMKEYDNWVWEQNNEYLSESFEFN